jgi:site-specific DNA recombinase
MRYAIWAAVSSERQAAPDKVSLDVQIDACRARAAQYGWRESAGPYIVPGETRTRWINLRDAEAALPPLRELLDAAQRGDFDLLLLYDFTRLRELIDPVTRALAAYGVQTYSLAQSVSPVEPAHFDKRISGTASVVQAFAMLTSRSEIENITKRLYTGRLGRLPKGLHISGPAPYGYKLSAAGPAAPLELDPPRAALVVKMKDLYLSGQTIPQIIEYLFENNFVPRTGGPRWSDYSIRYILRNPFYAGQVRYGLTRVTHDPRSGERKQILGDPAAWQTAPGLHEPLWDAATHAALLAEMARRAKRNKGPRTYTLSSLLTCAEHHRPLYVKCQHQLFVWFCPRGVKGHWHVSLRNDIALAWIANRLTSDLQAIQTGLKLPAPENPTPLLQDALSDLLARRERLTDALEAGSLDPATYAARTAALDTRAAEIRQQLSAAADHEGARLHRLSAANNLVEIIEQIPQFIAAGPPQQVNTALHALIRTITVTDEGVMDIEYK